MDDTRKFVEIEDETRSPGDRVKIVIDNRETREFDELLKQAGAIVERKQLEVGDFICSARCILERKTRDDFETSILDGRMFSQLKNLMYNYSRVIVIVEGEEAGGKLSKEALLGAYTSLVTDFGISLFFTRNKEKTAEVIYAIAKHEQLARKQPMRIFAKRKTYTIAQTQRSIIEMFPMVGPKLAKQLLENFGNIQNIINASEKELREIEGMGEKRARMICKIVNEQYQAEEDKFDMI